MVRGLVGLSEHQKKILEMLNIKSDMTTKEITEMLFGRVVEYKSKEFASVYRSLNSLERQSYIQRVQVQLRWRVSESNSKTSE